MKKLLLTAVLVVAARGALAWDKAPTPQRRLEILTGAAKRADHAELASCFAEPPTLAVWQNVLEETIAYEKAVSEVYKWTGEKFQQEGLDLLGDSKDAITPLHYLAGATITVTAVKEESPEKASAVFKFVDPDNFEGEHQLLLVKVGDDWRVLPEHDAWPASLPADAFSGLGGDLAKAASALQGIARGVQEDKVQKEQLSDPFISAKTLMKDAWAKVRAAVKAENEKAAAAIADAAAKEAAAKKKAADEEAAKKEAAKKAEAAKNAPRLEPPKPAPPVVEKKKEEPQEEKAPEPDNTGMYVVFGILGVACLGTVFVLLSKLKGEKRGGKGSAKRGKSGRSSGGGARRRRRGGDRRSSSADDADDDDA